MAHRHAFVTGYPGFIARRLVRKLLAADDQLSISALVLASEKAAAEAEVMRLGPGLGASGRVRLLVGDVSAMDVGLSGEEYRRLVDEITEIHHLAAVQQIGVARAVAERVNVGGTQNVLDLARSIRRLERLVHFSSAFVSGRRSGVVREEELEHGLGFRNPYEATKHQAERLVRAAADKLPITIVRPSTVVGDSRTGEIDHVDGVYSFILVLASSPAAIPIPLPGEGSAPLNLVPVDYVVDAVHAISAQPETIGKTFHIVDPNPQSARGVYALVAERAQKKVPSFTVSANLTKALLRIPGLERIAPASHQIVDYLNHFALWSSANTLDALEGTGIRCPRFETYVDSLVGFARRRA